MLRSFSADDLRLISQLRAREWLIRRLIRSKSTRGRVVVRARALIGPPSDRGALYPGFGETRGEERRARTIFENGFRIWRFHVRSWTPIARRRHTRDFSFMHTRCWQKTDCAVRLLGPPSISACAYRNVYARDRITHGAAPCTRFFLGVGSTPATINDRICLCVYDCLWNNQNGNRESQSPAAPFRSRQS